MARMQQPVDETKAKVGVTGSVAERTEIEADRERERSGGGEQGGVWGGGCWRQ